MHIHTQKLSGDKQNGEEYEKWNQINLDLQPFLCAGVSVL